MLPSAKLSLRIPDSPIDQTKLTSRAARRLFSATLLLGITLATLHSIGGQYRWQSHRSQAYLNLNHLDGSYIIAPQKRVDRDQSILEPEIDASQDLKSLTSTQLPEVVRIPFEEAVQDVKLQGWEDAWFAYASFDSEKFGVLVEPKIDFVYNWVNGSEEAFKSTRHQYELQSSLNDPNGEWISKHSINRYRDWDELRYSLRSLDKNAQGFINKIQLLVNSVQDSTNINETNYRPQRPLWLNDCASTNDNVQILRQEDFFGASVGSCVPTFDSVSIESQIYNTPSSSDQLVSLSDDMLLGVPHSPSDFHSPLFGSSMSFKSDSYNVKDIKSKNAPSFGEKPFLWYTSWLLNHRFGERERKAQAHFTHSISRRVMKEAMASFPDPAVRGACERFRGESKYQIYPWYAAYHYSIERFREALLWSFIMSRSDINSDGYLDWTERQAMLRAIKPGWHAVADQSKDTPAKPAFTRDRMYYHVPEMLRQAGLTPPKANGNILWTSLDGPETIRNTKCNNFHVDKCFGESFDSPISDTSTQNPDFTSANVFTHLSKHEPKCGDCLIKFMLSSTQRGLEPLLPPKSETRIRETIIKALVKYQHTVVEPDGMFVMIKDAEQAENELLTRMIKRGKNVSQLCLNDDVMTEDPVEVAKINEVMQTVFKTLFPEKGRWEN